MQKKKKHFLCFYTNCIYNTCWLLLRIAENGSESDKLLVNERDSECHEAVVSDSEVEIDNEMDEVCEVYQADK